MFPKILPNALPMLACFKLSNIIKTLKYNMSTVTAIYIPFGPSQFHPRSAHTDIFEPVCPAILLV